MLYMALLTQMHACVPITPCGLVFSCSTNVVHLIHVAMCIPACVLPCACLPACVSACVYVHDACVVQLWRRAAGAAHGTSAGGRQRHNAGSLGEHCNPLRALTEHCNGLF